MKKRILLVYSGECHRLPPFLTILDALHEEYQLKVISYETQKRSLALRESYPDVEFLANSIRPDAESFTDKVIRHIYYPITYHREVEKLIASTQYDLLWIIHEKTLLEFQDFLADKKYIVSFYELNDHDWSFVQKTQKGAKNAELVVCCEHNRSRIMRVWYKLSYNPPVIPNKPYLHPRQLEMPCPQSDVLKGKKIILYQGHVQRSRNIDTLCEALKDLPEFTLVVMGGGDKEYIDHLKANYKNIVFIGFVTPPTHLNVTSYAHIGVVKYDHIFLDHTYCAPNKIWEYSGFGIPMLANDLPGLEYTIGAAQAGLCVDFDDVKTIKNAIMELDKNYEQYKANALSFYDSIDIKEKLLGVATRFI